ncbi:SWI/SNF and RSC complex subunit Ssr3 [Syncephalastrum racemosum]|uniref:SWI/SNF and RSC complex subunit Ssr3 n=1 Tax=Syncephalastrum racemosum TaxID=13706 RepID=A0A1X2HSH9_SYNRA|nr:SWI/SNF and RSC complex subunit Ssr3 [Syncephalastrum racemosum]
MSQPPPPAPPPAQAGAIPPQQLPNQPMQYRKRPSEADSLSKHIKKKRPTDRNMPPKIEAFVPESKLYTELTEFEKKLDATIMRKRLDIQEALGKPTKTRRTLRIFVSNTAADQTAQNGDDENAFDLNSGNAPSWTLKIEGRLLDPPIPTKKAQPVQKFTSFFRSILVEMDRDPKMYRDGSNVVEWHKQANAPEYDGVEINRRGDTNVKVRIVLDPEYIPQKYKLNPALADLLDMKLETKPQIIMGLWNYVKNNKLQDAEDKRLIRCDPRLQQLFGVPQIHFAQLPDLINHHLSRPDPIVINYTIRVDKEFHQSAQAYDLDVELDSVVRTKMMQTVAATQTQKEIMQLDDKIVQCVQSINNSKIKRDFLMQFAQHPVEFINKWIASQARDLEVILGETKVNLEEMRQTDFYKQPWVKEAVFHYLTAKTQQRMQELLNTQRAPPQ